MPFSSLVPRGVALVGLGALASAPFAAPATKTPSLPLHSLPLHSSSGSTSKIAPRIAPRIAAKVQPFALREVRLLPGPFQHAQELDRKYLLSLQPDRFLHNFRVNAGLEPLGPLYGGWESQGIAGHTLGHYLTALAEMFEATGDVELQKKLDYSVSQLALCQSKSVDGYTGAAPDGRRVWDELKAGKVKASGFDLNGGWVPWYTQHKILAGLLDAYLLTGSEQAKTTLLRSCDFALDVTAGFDEAKWREMLKCEHGGMNELLANVYALTGEKKYLDLAHKFSRSTVFEPLSEGRDALTGMHANTQIPKVIGFERLYELEGDPKYGQAARFFWQTVTQNRSFATGGNSDREHFFAPEETAKHLSADSAENCNVYNMLKLTQALYEVSPENKWIEFYERALFNQILSSQDPEKGGFNYLNSLKPGGFKTYSNPTTAFWCCVGSGMENHAKYGESIYFHDDNSLLVNLFIASKVTWAQKGVTLTQNTRFPDADTAKFTVSALKPTRFTLKLRQPAWTSGAKLLLNGQVVKVSGHPGSYESIARTWKRGDTVTWQMPMALHSEGLVASPSQRAILYGPIVLAGEMGREGLDSISDYVDVQTKYSGFPAPQVPVLVSDADWETSRNWTKNIRRAAGDKLAFTLRDLPRTEDGQKAEVKLIPFARAHHMRYNVYWNLYSPTQWQERRAQIAAQAEAARRMAALTLDEVHPGEQQSEIDHGLQSQNSFTGDAFGGKWRDARDGGFFEFTIKVLPAAPTDLVFTDLVLTYWGGDGGNRSFDIVCDGQKIGTQSLKNQHPGEFFDVKYPLPAALIQGKTQVTIRIAPAAGSLAGGVFGIKTMRRSL